MKFEAEATSLRPKPKNPEAKAEARGTYEAEAKAKKFGLQASLTVHRLQKTVRFVLSSATYALQSNWPGCQMYDDIDRTQCSRLALMV